MDIFKRKQKTEHKRDMALEKAALEVYGIDFDSKFDELRAAAALALQVRLNRDPIKADLFYKKYAQYSNELESSYTASKNNGNVENRITQEKVITGLKYIAEHQTDDYETMRESLYALGCDFTLEDVRRQFHDETTLFESMKQGHLGGGASIICNVRDSEYNREYVNDRFLSEDDETSIYAFIRTVTGDESYTKDRIDEKLGISPYHK